MKTIEELTGYDKAAIIYDILGDSVAINMFKDIPEAELYELRKHASKIKREVSIRVKKDVLDDYYFKMLSAGKDEQVSLNENMFDFLNDLNDEQLSNLYFGIGKAYEDLKDYSKSFENKSTIGCSQYP